MLENKKVIIKKELREKGKSKYLHFRPDLQTIINLDVSGYFKTKEKETILANVERRKNLKINQPQYPESYYKDCYIYSKEYAERHEL